MTVAEAKERFTYVEFMEWMLYETIEPDVPERLDSLLTAILAQLRAAATRRSVSTRAVAPWWKKHSHELGESDYAALEAGFRAAGMVRG